MPTTYEKYMETVDSLRSAMSDFANAFKECKNNPEIDPEIWRDAVPDLKDVWEIEFKRFAGFGRTPETLAYGNVRMASRDEWEDYATSDNERDTIRDNIEYAVNIIRELTRYMGGEE